MGLDDAFDTAQRLAAYLGEVAKVADGFIGAFVAAARRWSGSLTA